MTVIARKKDSVKEDDRQNVTSGIQFHCDFCHTSLTHSVRIKCAAIGCEEVDVCPSCFCKGKEGGKHKRWHDYKVVEQHSYPIFTESWGADEELLLIEGLTLYGLGNWQDAAEHVGTRTREECEQHYLEVWIGDSKADSGVAAKGPITFDIDTETFQQRKKRRIEEMRAKPPQLPNPANSKPLVSAPTNHEVAGFMPGRLDFEHELHDEAENAVKDMEFGLVLKFGGEEQPGDGGVPAGPPASAVPLAIQQQQQAGTPAAGTPASATAAATPDTPAVDMKSEAKMEVDDDGDDDDEAEDEAKLAVALDPTRSARGVAGGGGGAGAGKTSSKSTTASSGGGSKQPLTAVPGRLLDDGNDSSASSTPEPSSCPPAPPTSTADSASSSQTPAPAPAPPPPPPPPPAAPVTAAPIPVNTDSPDYLEDPDDLELKLTVLEIYNDKLDRRAEAKGVIFQRGLMEHKKIVAVDKKKPQKDKDLVQKYKVFAKLQTAEDYEIFIDGLLYEQTLRTRISQLQTYRSKGIITVADAERYERELEYRTTGAVLDPKASRGPSVGGGPGGRYSLPSASAAAAGAGIDSKRQSLGPSEIGTDSAPRSGAYAAHAGGRKPPAPLNLASAASLHLLTAAEQELCSTLRILPKPYLLIKETLIREYARRNGNLRRREARGLIKIDVNKTSKVWDLLVEMGCFENNGAGSNAAAAAHKAPVSPTALKEGGNGNGGESTVVGEEAGGGTSAPATAGAGAGAGASRATTEAVKTASPTLPPPSPQSTEASGPQGMEGVVEEGAGGQQPPPP